MSGRPSNPLTTKLTLPNCEDRLDLRDPDNPKSPTMRAYENLLGESIEDMLRAGFKQTKSLRKTAGIFNIHVTTLHVWFRQLGLYICISCSKQTGSLFDHTTECPGCNRWFCDRCLALDSEKHSKEILNKTICPRASPLPIRVKTKKGCPKAPQLLESSLLRSP